MYESYSSAIVPVFESKKIFLPSQFGIRKNKSTAQSCTSLLRYLYDTLNRGDIAPDTLRI